MSEIPADLADGNALFEQMRAKRMAKRMGGERLLDPASGADDTHRQLDGGDAHRLFALSHRLGQREVAAFPEPSDGGEKPLAVAVKAPVGAQPLDHLRGDRHLPGLAALPVAYAHHAAPGIDVGRRQSDRLAQTQPAVIDQRQDRFEPILPHGGEDLPNLAAGENDRQRGIAIPFSGMNSRHSFQSRPRKSR